MMKKIDEYWENLQRLKEKEKDLKLMDEKRIRAIEEKNKLILKSKNDGISI